MLRFTESERGSAPYQNSPILLPVSIRSRVRVSGDRSKLQQMLKRLLSSFKGSISTSVANIWFWSHWHSFLVNSSALFVKLPSRLLLNAFYDQEMQTCRRFCVPAVGFQSCSWCHVFISGLIVVLV